VAGVRHVWVRPPFAPVELPGLVLGWRQDGEGWVALTVWIENTGRVVTDWLPAGQLRPADGRPRTGSAYG
jgi:hypothetical protein